MSFQPGVGISETLDAALPLSISSSEAVVGMGKLQGTPKQRADAALVPRHSQRLLQYNSAERRAGTWRTDVASRITPSGLNALRASSKARSPPQNGFLA